MPANESGQSYGGPYRSASLLRPAALYPWGYLFERSSRSVGVNVIRVYSKTEAATSISLSMSLLYCSTLGFTAAFFVSCCSQIPRLLKKIKERRDSATSGYHGSSYDAHTSPRSERNRLSGARMSRKVDPGETGDSSSSSARGLRDYTSDDVIPTEHHIGLDSVERPGIAL